MRRPIAEPGQAPERGFHAALSEDGSGEAGNSLERCLGDSDVRPDRIKQLFLADRAVLVPEEVCEEIEDQWLRGDLRAGETQAARTSSFNSKSPKR